MSQRLASLLCLALATLSVRTAHADPVNYAITFLPSYQNGAATPTGSFTYDASTQTFSSFVVEADGFTFDFTSKANAATGIVSGGNCAAATLFTYLTTEGECGSGNKYVSTFSFDLSGEEQFVDFTVPGDVQFSFGYPDLPIAGSVTFLTQTDPTDSTDNAYSVGFFTTAVTPSTTPEPSGLLLLGSGAIATAGMVRRRLKRR